MKSFSERDSSELEVRWVIESGIFSYTDDLIKYLEENGIYYKETNYQEIVSHKYDDKYGYLGDDEVATIFVGSLRLAKRIKQYPIDPGVICTLDNFKCIKYYPSWSPYLLNHDWSLKMKCLLERDIRHLEGRDPVTQRELFFRPDSGDKSFTGGVFTRTQIAEYIKDDEIVIQADKKNLGDEYRFLIVDREIVNESGYNGTSVNNPKSYYAYDYLEQVLKDNNLFLPDRAFTVDIAENLDTRELAVVELNSFSCANLYGMDMSIVVPAINELAKDMYYQKNIDNTDW